MKTLDDEETKIFNELRSNGMGINQAKRTAIFLVLEEKISKIDESSSNIRDILSKILNVIYNKV
jgi:hypothetical protein